MREYKLKGKQFDKHISEKIHKILEVNNIYSKIIIDNENNTLIINSIVITPTSIEKFFRFLKKFIPDKITWGWKVKKCWTKKRRLTKNGLQ